MIPCSHPPQLATRPLSLLQQHIPFTPVQAEVPNEVCRRKSSLCGLEDVEENKLCLLQVMLHVKP